ncbi:MAG: FtsX-like permease family protein, partial [Pseudomonadota bacterium]
MSLALEGGLAQTEGNRNAATLTLAFRFAARELRGGLRGFYIFLACIALGVAAISGVNAVALSITSGIEQEGRVLLGGDASFKTNQRRLSDAERSFVEAAGETSTAANMRSMARLPDGSDQSVIELKSVDAAWPLTGTATTEPAGALAQVKAGEGIVADPIFLERLGISIGDSVAIGTGTFPVLGTVVDEPDRVSDGFLVGPRVLMGEPALDRTGLIQPGSLVEWTTRLRLDDPSEENLNAVTASARQDFPEAGWRVRARDNAAPSLTRNVDRFSQFLTLVGLTALIVGGVGVANAVRAYLDTKRPVIATFKSLGAPARFVFSVYLIQILLLALAGIVIGLAVGGTLPFIAKWALEGVLPVGNASAFHWPVLLSAVAYGLLTALAFALWPLG